MNYFVIKVFYWKNCTLLLYKHFLYLPHSPSLSLPHSPTLSLSPSLSLTFSLYLAFFHLWSCIVYNRGCVSCLKRERREWENHFKSFYLQTCFLHAHGLTTFLRTKTLQNKFVAIKWNQREREREKVRKFVL